MLFSLINCICFKENENEIHETACRDGVQRIKTQLNGYTLHHMRNLYLAQSNYFSGGVKMKQYAYTTI